MAIRRKNRPKNGFRGTKRAESEIPYIRVVPKVPIDPKTVELAEQVLNSVIAPMIDWNKLASDAHAEFMRRAIYGLYPEPEATKLWHSGQKWEVDGEGNLV